MKIKFLVASLFTLLLTTALNAQQPYKKPFRASEQDRLIFEQLKQEASKWDAQSTSQWVLEIGSYFINTPYVAHTLENKSGEVLTANLRDLDCTTFVESTLALARTISWGDVGFEQYLYELEKIRYRDGIMTDYTSRLHYFSDWIFDNEQRGIVKNATQEIGGKPLSLQVNFMTKHYSKYPALLRNKDFVWGMQKVEKQINARQHFFIEKSELASLESKLQSGDIIAITSGKQGLDISHVGIAISQNGRIHLLHASYTEKKVCITKQSLVDYLSSSSNTGIVVVRY